MKKNLFLALALLLFCGVANAQSSVEGSWNSTLNVQGTKLRLVFHITQKDGKYSAKLDSPDQGAKGISCGKVTFEEPKLTIEMPALQAKYEGTLSGNTISGSFSQMGQTFPLKLVREGTSPEADKADALTYQIRGKVVDKDGGVVVFPSLSVIEDLMMFEPTQRVMGNDNGEFSITHKANPSDSIMLSIVADGKNALNRIVRFADQTTIDLDTIQLQNGEQLQEFSVVAYKPLVTQELDRLKYDVEADPSSQTNSTMDMLRKVPMITIDHEENIKVKGNSSFKIYINGKPSNIVSQSPKDVLKAMPASSIKRIEVITDPGAKYDAEGVKAIINIVTKSALQGYQGTINARYEMQQGNTGVGAYFSAKIGKFGFTANYNYYLNNNTQSIQYLNSYKNENLPFATQGAEEYWRIDNYNVHMGGLEMSYEFDSLNLLSANVNFWGNKTTMPAYSVNSFQADKYGNVTGRYFQTTDMYNATYAGIDGNIDYQHSFPKDGQMLTLSYRISTNPTNTSNRFHVLQDSITPAIGVENISRYTLTKAHGTEHTAQVDYVEPFSDGKHTMEVGVKYILRNNMSDNTYLLYNPTTSAYDLKDHTQNENDMNYYQHVFGAYGAYTFRHDKFSIRLGARVEGNIQDVRFLEDRENMDFKAKFIDVVPSVSFNYMLASSQSLSVSYNNTIARPSIFYLNPYVNRIDEYTIQYGNPNLRSERSHNVSLTYGFYAAKLNLSVSLDGDIVNNAIMPDYFVDDNGVYIQTYANIGRSYKTGISLFASYNPTQWASLWINASPSYSYYQEEEYNVGSFGVNLFGGVNFNLPWKLRLELGGGGTTPSTTYRDYFGGFYYYYAGIYRNFLKNDQLRVGVTFVNPHSEYIPLKVGMIGNDANWEANCKQRMRQFQVSVSWRFGEMKSKIATAERSIENNDLKAGGSKGGGSSQGIGM